MPSRMRAFVCLLDVAYKSNEYFRFGRLISEQATRGDPRLKGHTHGAVKNESVRQFGCCLARLTFHRDLT
jgi:hypothetical protein